LLRFLRFALPHWKLMVVAFGAMTLTSLAGGGLLVLLKPVVEGFIGEQRPSYVQAPSAVAQAGRADAGRQEGAPALTRWQAWRRGVREAVLSSRPIRALVDYVGPGPDQIKHVAILILAVIAPLWVITAFLETYCTGRVLWNVMADLRVAVFEKLSRMPLGYFASRRTGDLISRLTNDVTTTRSSA